MPWYFPWSDHIKKRACRYLLQHYLGHFLKEKLTLDQLSVDLYNGTGIIKDVLLDVWALNDALDTHSIPIQIVDGFVGQISMSIPWSNLISDSTIVEIHGIELTIQPKQRNDHASVMIDSMFSSMTSSMQLAKDCLKEDQQASEYITETATPFEGLEMFAQTIESVLSKVKVTFLDTVIRVEHLPKEAKSGVALEIRIKRIDYFDDQAMDEGSPVDSPPTSGRNVYEPAAVAHKNFHILGMEIFCDEFLECNRTYSRSSSNSSGSPSLSPQTDDTILSPPLTPPPRSGDVPVQTQPMSTSQLPQIQSEPIKVATCSGRQEVKLKIKQRDGLPGPKLEIDIHLGAFNVFLSPRQVHILLELCKGLSSPGTSDDSNVKQRSTQNKPMQADDYQKVEHELQRQLQQDRVQHQLGGATYAWKDADDAMMTHPLDDSDLDDDIYFSLAASSHAGMTDMESSFGSNFSGSTSKSGSTVTSVGYSYGAPVIGGAKKESPFQATIPKAMRKQRSSKQKESLHKLLDDPGAETTRFRLRVTFFSLTVLHEDPPPTPSDGIDPGRSSAEQLQTFSDNFFSKIKMVNISGMGTDLVELREKYSEACPHDHLGYLGKPVTLECNQKSSAAVQSLTVELTIGLMEAVEALFDRRGATSSIMGFSLPIDNVLPSYSELLTFIRDVSEAKQNMFSSMQAAPSPCVRLRVQNLEKSQQSSRRQRAPPRTSVNIELGRLRSQLDITIVDRIHALLNPQPLLQTDQNGTRLYKSLNPNINSTRQAYFSQAMDEGPSGDDRKINLHVTSPFASLTVRFPIPDLRTGQNVDRLPWWIPALRKEVLILELTEANFSSQLSSVDAITKLEFMCKDIHGLFQMSPEEPPLSFARISHGGSEESAAAEKEDGFDWPRVVVKLYPQTFSVLDDDGEEEDSTPHDSLNGACQFSKPSPSPFSTKKVMYDNEELVIPGDRAEMTEFQEKAANNTRMLLDLTLPNVNVVLHNKNFFEILYNRINNDLLLWEPLAPAPLDPQEQFGLPMGHVYGLDLASQLLHQDTRQDRFVMCKSGIQYDSSSDSEEGTGQFYSIYEQKARQRGKQRQEQRHQQSKVCVNVNITQGKILACSRLKDDSGEVNTEKQGEFLLEVEDGNIFCVSSYNGDPDLLYVCIQSNRTALYHSGCVDIPLESSVIERACFSTPPTQDATIYLSEPGVYTKLAGQVGGGADTLDMLSVALKINLDTFRNVKEFLVAVGLRGGTLQHRVQPSTQHWFPQIMDFFDVVDYAILGYTLPEVVTELHLHLWSCSVDYRPLYMPLRAMLTAEMFSISSNIIAESPTSLLRFILDDAALYLSDRCHASSVDLKRNYVCVLDVGLFELSLRTSDGKDPKYPKTDFRASNNILHVRTCADSCKALQELIVYFAGDGDLQPPLEDSASTATPRKRSVDDTASRKSESVSSGSPLTQSHMEQVHDMMADAMKESTSPNTSREGFGSPSHDGAHGTELYFFPDESQTAPKPQWADPAGRNMAQYISDEEEITGSTLSEDTEQVSSGEEFCIIDDLGLGISSRDGEPVVRVLSQEPIQVVEDHFTLPLGKTDQLKAPEHFPPAVYRYTLREMSLVWYMYGGQDFGHDTSKHIRFQGSPGSVRKGKGMKEPHKSRQGKLAWQASGGPGRDLDILMELQLNKVRMQHESFPENTEQASRQIILIHEVEIRDRLASSHINKFLYHYTSEAMPRQSHANMVVIKLLHVRPDPVLLAQECSLKVSLLPLRLNIDQDAVFFLRNFFTAMSGGGGAKSVGVAPSGGGPPIPDSSSSPSPAPAAASVPKAHQAAAPVMTVAGHAASPPPDPQDLLIMFDEITSDSEEDDEEGLEEEEEDVVEQEPPIFFKCFVFSPDVPIRLDYAGKRVDMEQGTLAGLLVGLAQLNTSELRLTRINHRHGLLGFDRLLIHALNHWLGDIKKNQLPSILGGVGPMHSLVQLVQGIRDLFWLPVEQYKKDGRLVRGIQRGASSFTTSTAMAALELTNRVVQTVQYFAEVAFDMVSPGPSVRKRRRKKRHRRAQPADLREGVTNAYHVLREGVSETASTIARVAREEHENKGVTGAVGGVLRQIPPTIVQPVILATEATSNVLGGMRNQLLPDARKEEEKKWKQEQD